MGNEAVSLIKQLSLLGITVRAVCRRVITVESRTIKCREDDNVNIKIVEPQLKTGSERTHKQGNVSAHRLAFRMVHLQQAVWVPSRVSAVSQVAECHFTVQVFTYSSPL